MLRFIEDLIASRMGNCFPERFFIHKEFLIIMLGFKSARGLSPPTDGGGDLLIQNQRLPARLADLIAV